MISRSGVTPCGCHAARGLGVYSVGLPNAIPIWISPELIELGVGTLEGTNIIGGGDGILLRFGLSSGVGSPVLRAPPNRCGGMPLVLPMLMPISPVRNMSSLESRFSKLGLVTTAALLPKPKVAVGPEEVLGLADMVALRDSVAAGAAAAVARTAGAEDLGVLGGGGGGRGRSR